MVLATGFLCCLILFPTLIFVPLGCLALCPIMLAPPPTSLLPLLGLPSCVLARLHSESSASVYTLANPRPAQRCYPLHSHSSFSAARSGDSAMAMRDGYLEMASRYCELKKGSRAHCAAPSEERSSNHCDQGICGENRKRRREGTSLMDVWTS